LCRRLVPGKLVNLSVGDSEHDDPAHGATWDDARTVRAELLTELLTAERATSRPRAIKIKGARITGPLDLEALALACPLLLRGCRIDEPINLDGASLNNAEGMALNLEAARVAQLMLRLRHPPNGIVDLTNARVGVFYDDQATWPSVLRLRGFTYETLDNDQVSVRDRLCWLARQPGDYTPQIYDQLADAYRRAGQAEAARKVGVAKQRRRRGNLNPFNWLLYLTVGYGYRTWLAAVWLAGLGWWVFTGAHPGHMVQATPNRTGPGFHALAYTLDVLLPIVDLGQEKAWTPRGWAAYWTWSLIAVGWVLTTAVVAGLTGIFKRD
jgi:hypothetical protein